MGPFIRKTKKLITQPRKFFIDRKRKIEATTQPTTTSPKKPQQKQKLKYKLYLNSNFTSNDKLYSHAINILKNHANVHIGEFRFAQSDIVLDISGKIYTAELSSPIEKSTLVKGFFLATPKETFEPNQHKNDSIFLDLLHQINIEHMKSISDFNLLYRYYENRPERNEQSQVKYALNAGIYEENIIEKAINLLSSQNNLPTRDIAFTFKKIYRVLGTDQKLEPIANKLFILIKKEQFPVDFIMLLAAFFTESGDFKRALETASIAKKNDVNAWIKYRYLGLSHLLYSNGQSAELEIKLDHDLYLTLSRNEWEFENYLIENARSLAVVGNSPVEVSKRKGETIDSYNKVLRFNSAITDYPYSLDYGKKTNILIINPRYYETQRNKKFDLDFVIISDGNLFSTKDLYYKINDLLQFTDKICLIPRKVDLQLTQKIYASPSSGLKFLTWLYAINGAIPKKSLFGFSLTDQAHGVATSYANGRKVGLNTIHNWSSEKIHLEEVLLKENTEEFN
ncbi:glycosyltransferase family 29 protein [Pseudomonas sp. p50]|uniref:glycosyltransferase family 29 protein n=1 Tax=Pseudomonas sp. p50(2008) TaxID=2816832 RepID=UPI00188D1846|nr:glycosyltransferase family 29 protein [Pseudomonas sp. p50(2008)]MBF4554904.1 glycosyltransferase family 29 protein [Pseudomonas sp. p50(2008)]